MVSPDGHFYFGDGAISPEGIQCLKDFGVSHNGTNLVESAIFRSGAYSPDGLHAAFINRSGLLEFWDLVDNQRICQVPLSAEFLSFSNDGRYLTCLSKNGEITILDGGASQENMKLSHMDKSE